MRLANWEPGERVLNRAGLLVIIGLALVPLLFTFPYRVNIFLSWEGAYRMSEGQWPYFDFGTPLGGMYWVIPALFFKIFGPQLFTLVKAQVFINIISGLSFASILRSVGVKPGIRFIAILLFCISYSFFNFWPWYNHTVIVYELIALAFLFKGFGAKTFSRQIMWVTGAGLFTVFSFFTKQDGGALAFMIGLALSLYVAWQGKEWKWPLVYALSFFGFLFLFIGILSRGSFGYWFNHGQPPHTARFSIREILGEFFISTQALKFYLLLFIPLVWAQWKAQKDFFKDRQKMLFLLLTLGILCEAAIFQVTSYTPPDNNIFYHAFAFAWLFSVLLPLLKINEARLSFLTLTMAGVLLWWSQVYWKYIERVVERIAPETAASSISPTGENLINRRTYIINTDTTEIPTSEWEFSGLKSFDKVYMPKGTVEGIRRLMSSPVIKSKGAALKLLNMSELTPLAAEIPYALERNPSYPLWFHLGVGMFNQQAAMFEQRIKDQYYDLVLFEYIPRLNNFYPFRVRDSLRQHYKLIDSFAAPRRGVETPGQIEVYQSLRY